MLFAAVSIPCFGAAFIVLTNGLCARYFDSSLVKPRRASERLHQGEFAFKDNSTSSPDFAQTFPTYTVSLTPTLPTPTIPTEKTHPVPSSTKPVSEPEGPFGALKSQGRRKCSVLLVGGGI